MLTGMATDETAVPPDPVTVSVHAAAVDGVVGDDTGVTVTCNGLGPLLGLTDIAAPGAHV